MGDPGRSKAWIEKLVDGGQGQGNMAKILKEAEARSGLMMVMTKVKKKSVLKTR